MDDGGMARPRILSSFVYPFIMIIFSFSMNLYKKKGRKTKANKVFIIFKHKKKLNTLQRTSFLYTGMVYGVVDQLQLFSFLQTNTGL